MSHWSPVLYSCVGTIKQTVARRGWQLQWVENEWAQGMSEGGYGSISQGTPGGPERSEESQEDRLGGRGFLESLRNGAKRSLAKGNRQTYHLKAGEASSTSAELSCVIKNLGFHKAPKGEQWLHPFLGLA